ncbi:MAG: V-type ATP synthase subunit F [Candidatus Jordarchaeaceae archaeon]
MNIAVIADEETINCFKLTGVENTYTVKNPEEAKKKLYELRGETDLAIIITTDEIANTLHETIIEITENQEYPIILSIPNLGNPPMMKFDAITELIKRKIGIELKL